MAINHQTITSRHTTTASIAFLTLEFSFPKKSLGQLPAGKCQKNNVLCIRHPPKVFIIFQGPHELPTDCCDCSICRICPLDFPLDRVRYVCGPDIFIEGKSFVFLKSRGFCYEQFLLTPN